MKDLGYHDGYIYPHDYPEHFHEQQYLPDELRDTHFWEPADNAQEDRQRERLNRLWNPRKW